MKIYISGPMTGLPLHNFPAFEAAAASLRAAGHLVLSPHEKTLCDGFDPALSEDDNAFDLRAALLWDCEAVASSDAVALLPGFEESAGAAMEVALAVALGLPVLRLADLCEARPAG